MKRLLYGASVQGIQGFIYQTNKLKDIIGASELVKEICSTRFEEFKANGDLVVSAAGNIKCMYDSEEECRHAVYAFPKRVMEAAPGITVSQAVVEYAEGMSFKDAVDALEKRLHAQRNRQAKSLVAGCMAMERSRGTGLPAVTSDKEFLDEGTLAKRKAEGAKAFARDLGNWHAMMPTNINSLTGQNDWIAIVHADGNGLGAVVSKIGSDKEALHHFSHQLDEATKQAFLKSCEDMWPEEQQFIPLRPVVLGGDDLTMICRGDVAMPFLEHYLKHFEEKSKRLTGHRLTACAGIAYVKSSYPFYYGYNLAEALCETAKKDAKREEMKAANGGSAPSCLMFHKVQSSFVESYAEIISKELTPSAGHSYLYGPYYLTEQKERWTIEQLREVVRWLTNEANNPIRTSLREWLTLMSEGVDAARQKTERVRLLTQYGKEQKERYMETVTGEQRDSVRSYPVYDILSLLTVNNQETR